MTNNLYLPTATSGGQCRIWGLRLLLLAMIVLPGLQIQAAWKLTVFSSDGEHHVYTSSTDNVTSANLVSGTIKFNANSGNVTLDNVVFVNNTSGVDGCFFSLSSGTADGESTTITVIGTNKVTVGGDFGILLVNTDVTIQREIAAGMDEYNCVFDITCSSSLARGISLHNSGVFVSNCTVKINGGAYGIAGERVEAHNILKTTHAIIRAEGNKASIGNLAALTLGNSNYIIKPEDAEFSASVHGIQKDGKLITSQVLISDKEYKKPEPGTALEVTAIAGGKAIVGWGRATDNFTPQEYLRYQLSYKKSDEVEWTTATDFVEDMTSFTVSGLSGDAPYDFKVTVKDEMGNTAEYEVVSATLIKSYTVFVGGVQVTSDNQSNITGDCITEGTVTFDPETNTLTLNNATISGSDMMINVYKMPEINLKVIGENYVYSSGNNAIRLSGNAVITGGGTLYAYSTRRSGSYAGIWLTDYNYQSSLTVDHTTVDAFGRRGIAGIDLDHAEHPVRTTLVIKNSNIKAKGQFGSIVEIGDLLNYGCHISSPSNADFDSEKEAVTSNGSTVTDEITFVPSKITVCGLGVAPNRQYTRDLRGGTILYDEDMGTLQLSNVNFVTESQEKTLGVNGVGDINIVLEGSNLLKGVNGVDVYGSGGSKATMTICGAGSLDIVATDETNGIGIMLNNMDVSIDNSQVNITARNGINGFLTAFASLFGLQTGTGTYETLTVQNSSLSMTHESGFPFLLDGIYLQDCTIEQPVNATYDLGKIVVNGEDYHGKLVISPIGGATAIDGNPVTAKKIDDAPWTTLDGRRIDKPGRTGIYLHGNKKVVVK